MEIQVEDGGLFTSTFLCLDPVTLCACSAPPNDCNFSLTAIKAFISASLCWWLSKVSLTWHIKNDVQISTNCHQSLLHVSQNGQWPFFESLIYSSVNTELIWLVKKLTHKPKGQSSRIMKQLQSSWVCCFLKKKKINLIELKDL